MSENRKIKFTTNKGVFVAEMFEDKAPLTTKNFIELVEKGFYDGIIFHRVIDGFMIQGGDPTGTGMGGPGYKIKDEFGEGLKHDDEGILSMANAGPNTGGSQFFITLAPTPWLNGHHAIFGKVVEGMDVVRLIGVVPTDFRDRPREAVTMEKVEVVNKWRRLYICCAARTAAYIQAGPIIWSTVWQCITADAAQNIRVDAVLWSWSTAKSCRIRKRLYGASVP